MSFHFESPEPWVLTYHKFSNIFVRKQENPSLWHLSPVDKLTKSITYCFFFLAVEDVPVDGDVLEELSEEIGNGWEKLARRLGFKDSDITGFHKNNEEYAKKAYKMLKKWKEEQDLDATYDVLYEALCHKFVGRKDLANKFCTIDD